MRLADTADLAACEHCGAALYLDLSGTAVHTVVEPTVPQSEIAPRLGRALAAREVLDDLVIETTSTVLVPYFGRGEARSSRLCCALALPEPAPAELRHLRGELTFFDEWTLQGARSMEPELSLDEACGAPKEDGLSPQLVHVPFYEVRYRCQGQSHEALVDAMTGQVSAERWPCAPSRELNRELWLVASFWGLAYVICVAALPSWPWVLLGLVVVSALGYQLALWRLRSRGW